MGNVFVTRVRQTETQLLELGVQGLPLARAAQACLHRTVPLSVDQRAHLDTQLTAALEAQQRSAHQSRRLIQGQALTPCNIVNASDPTRAPIGKGQRHCPAQFGRQPGLIAEPAAGVIVALHLPVGNPSDASSVQPLVDKVQQAIAQMATAPRPVIHSLAGDLAFNDASLRAALHRQGILTVGLPKTAAPVPPAPTPEDVRPLLREANGPRARPPGQVHRAYAAGDSRPGVERLLASRLGRGAARLTYTGHHGATRPMGMTIMAPNGATWVRIHAYRLSTRARMVRRRLRLRCRKVNPGTAAIN